MPNRRHATPCLRALLDTEESRRTRRHRDAMRLVDEAIDSGVPVIIRSKWDGAEHSRPWKE